jgi:hypothetical protein
MLKLLFILAFTMASAHAQTEATPCAQKGGVLSAPANENACVPPSSSGETCWCRFPQIAIDPGTQSCFDLALAEFAANPAPTAPQCQEKFVSEQMAEGRFNCDDPITFCDMQRNPFYREYLENRHKNAASGVTDDEILGQPEMQKFLREHDASDCRQLQGQAYDQCIVIFKQVSDRLQGSVTDGIKGRVDELLVKAKGVARLYVEKQIADCRDCTPETLRELQQTLGRIAGVQLVLTDDRQLRPQARVDSSRGEDAHYECRLGGIHLDTEFSPMSVLRVITHELGHVMHPITAKAIENKQDLVSVARLSEEHPAMRAASCLQSFNEAGDEACFEQAIARMEEPQKTQQLGRLAIYREAKKINPFSPDLYNGMGTRGMLSVPGRLVESGGTCEILPCQGQDCAEIPCLKDNVLEPYGDFISGELMGMMEDVDKAQAMEALSGMCLGKFLENGEPEILSGRGTAYPSTAKRMEIFLANPQVRQKVGCAPEARYRSRLKLPPTRHCGTGP